MNNYMTISGQFVELQLMKRSSVSLEVFSLTGKRLGSLSQKRMLDAGKHTFRIPEGWAIHGMMMAMAKINGSVLTKKMIISH